MKASFYYLAGVLFALIFTISGTFSCEKEGCKKNEIEKMTTEELREFVETAINEKIKSTKGTDNLPFLIQKMRNLYYETYLNENAEYRDLSGTDQAVYGALGGALVLGISRVATTEPVSKRAKKLGTTVGIVGGAAILAYNVNKGYQNQKIKDKIDKAREGESFKTLFKAALNDPYSHHGDVFDRVTRGIRQNWGLERLIKMTDNQKGKEFSLRFIRERDSLADEFKDLELASDEKTQLLNEVASEVALLRLFSSGATDLDVILQVDELISRVIQALRTKLQVQELKKATNRQKYPGRIADRTSVHQDY